MRVTVVEVSEESFNWDHFQSIVPPNLQTPLSPLIRNSASESTAPKFEGFLVDLVHKLAEDLDLQLDFAHSLSKGSLDKRSGNWTGGIGDIVSGVSDFNAY